MKTIVRNKYAREYEIEEKYICGIALAGSEVKSIRQGKVSIDEAVVNFVSGRPFILNMHISPYQNSPFNPEPTRPRALLMTKREIERIYGLTTRRGYKIIPLSVMIKDNKLVKIEIGVGKRKKIEDRRRDIIEKEERRKLREIKKF
ncbi:MAG: SsrA-binding protein SmpB [Candidatus Calescibacterium sp.]|nr:SsrA-binding protein SmpB [Candidatus Calescibacterium sp.]MCX7734798.1 SsrA-binding protein SmpB [bacterium]MDW8087389.1 SsrA-binding protein SmpB [Candidatus Calescibacterium sp.]